MYNEEDLKTKFRIDISKGEKYSVDIDSKCCGRCAVEVWF